MMRRVAICLVACLMGGCAGQLEPAAETPGRTLSLPMLRTPTRPFLNMPETGTGNLPPLLSQTGAFSDVRTLQPASGLLPYDLVVAFWSDGAAISRLVAIPEGKVAFSADGDWSFPPGTVFVKTFELPLDAAQPQRTRRLETRLLVVDRAGG